MPPLSSSNPPNWSVCSALCILMVLLPEAKAAILNATTERNGGGSQCGDYTNQVTPEYELKTCSEQTHFFFYCTFKTLLTEIVPDQIEKHDAVEEVLNDVLISANSVQSVSHQTDNSPLLIFNFWLMRNDLDVFLSCCGSYSQFQPPIKTHKAKGLSNSHYKQCSWITESWNSDISHIHHPILVCHDPSASFELWRKAVASSAIEEDAGSDSKPSC